MTFMPAPPGIDSQAASTPSTEPFYRRHLVALVVFFAGMGFLAAPWPFETKAHAVMHGLCAQTPSHSFYFQGLVLPFDGRMTGIYGGVLSAFLILLALGRHRAAGLPSSGSLVILLLFVVAMAVDGFNSLLTDLQRWHPYQPSNELRLLTGWMAGVAIGTVVVMLVGMTFWRSPRVSQRVVSHWWLPILMVLPIIPIRLLIETGSLLVYYPFSFLLMASAVIVFTTLVLVTILMLLNRENQIDRFVQVKPLAALSIVVAIAIILAIGGARFWLEAVTNAPALV